MAVSPIRSLPRVMCASFSLPNELWADILGLLPPSDLGRALCVSRTFANLGNEAWRAACYQRWPSWAAVASELGAQWRRQYELLSLRESEEGTVPDLAAIRKLQQNVTERHRAILTHWLVEASVGPAGRVNVHLHHLQPPRASLSLISF